MVVCYIEERWNLSQFVMLATGRSQPIKHFVQWLVSVGNLSVVKNNRVKVDSVLGRYSFDGF
jgi:hypothetical protein